MFAAATTGGGAAVGLVLGSLWEIFGLPHFGLGVAALVCVAAALADLVGLPVICTRRQVPQVWGRLLPPVTVAVLYGTRLGVGPLTILNSWSWWAGALLGASHGPWTSVAVGALFGGIRSGVTALAGLRHPLPRPTD